MNAHADQAKKDAEAKGIDWELELQKNEWKNEEL